MIGVEKVNFPKQGYFETNNCWCGIQEESGVEFLKVTGKGRLSPNLMQWVRLFIENEDVK